MSTTTFTIEGRGLKLQTADDVKEFVEKIEGMDALENVILSGNTFGVEACRALAAALAKKPLLKVYTLSQRICLFLNVFWERKEERREKRKETNQGIST